MIPRRTAPDPDVLALLLARLPAEGPDARGAELLRAGLGGVVLPAAVTAPAELARTVRRLREDCVVAAAEDGGDRPALPAADGSPLPTAWALGEIDDVDLTRELGDGLGDLLAACDADLLLGPVLDVAAGTDPLVGTRAFGEEPDLVTRHARALAGGVRDAGVAVCALPFPGTGAQATGGPARIDLSREELAAAHLGPWELVPWLDAVMTAPVPVPALGAGPASLGPWAAPLLAELAHGGFHGLLIAGRLDEAAAAAGCDLGEAAVRAVEAGAHLLDLGETGSSPLVTGVQQAHDAIVDALAGGRLDERTLREHAETSRARVRALRARRRWLPTPDRDASLRTLEQAGAAAALRAVRVRRARLDPRPAAVLDVRDPRPVPGPDGRWSLAAALRDQGITADTHAEEHEALRAPQVLVLTGRPRTDPGEAARLHRLLATRPDAIVIHTGIPGLAPEAERLVLAHGSGRAMMRASVEALTAA